MTDASTADDLEPTDLKWIGPATAEAFSEADFTARDVEQKTVSYQLLVDAGVNPGVAAKIRREHSLSWSFEAGDGLSERSAQVRGLGTDEAAWVEASSSGEWEDAAEADDTADPGASDEDAWVAASGAESPDDTAESTTAETTAAGSTAATDDGTYFTATANSDGPAPDAEADGSGDPAAAEAAWRERSEPTPVTDLGPVDEGAEALLADAGITSVRSLATADPEHVADVLDIDQGRVTAWHDAARDAEE